MQLLPTIISASLFCVLFPCVSYSGVELYSGDMDVVSVSGKACAGFTGTANCVSSLLKTGRAFLSRDEFSAALESFQKASLLMPKSKEAIAAVMSVYIRTRDFDGAIVFLERALKSVDSENVRQDVQGALGYVYLLRSKKLEKDGKDAEAEADLKNAEAHDPYSVQYLIALARLRHKAGSLIDAEKLLQKGLDRFHQESARQEIIASRDKMRQIEAILKKLRRAGG